MNLLGMLCAVMGIAPFALYLYAAIHDRLTERRDKHILAKSEVITLLFEEQLDRDQRLCRVYLQSYHGDGYPYDLFMIEYRGGQHVTDTIWLPVSKFLKAADAQLLDVLRQELDQPGEYTVSEWTEAIYEYILQQAGNTLRGRKPG